MRSSFGSAALLAASAWIGLLPGCAKHATATSATAPARRVELVVDAATSTRDALLSLEADYEREHSLELVFDFGASGDLARQIVAAAQADVFLSADEQEMDRVDAARLLEPGTRRDLLSNQLVVIEPAGGASSFHAPFEPAQLAAASVVRLSLANTESVPAGRYARAWLERAGVWNDVAARVLPAIDVRAALSVVEAGAAQAGIVYRTDLTRSKKARAVFAVPLDAGPRIAYPVAVIANRPMLAEARAFVAFLDSPAARAAFEQQGFVHLAAEGQKEH